METTTAATATFAEYLRLVATRHDPDQRAGQRAFNLLHDVHPTLARVVTDRPYTDPFYDDDMLPEFFRFVGEEWDKLDIDATY